MKKMKIMLGAFLCFSFTALASMELNSGEIQQKDGIFTMKDGKVLEGEYKIKNMDSKSSFLFQAGKIQKFSFDSREDDDFEIDGRFIDNYKLFKGEVSIQQISNIDAEKKLTEELSLDGSMEAKDIAQFASDVLTKKEAEIKKPTFANVSVWKMQDGERELEKEVVKKVDKQENASKIMLLEIEKSGEKQIYSAGKVVHTAKSKETNMEKKIKTQ